MMKLIFFGTVGALFSLPFYILWTCEPPHSITISFAIWIFLFFFFYTFEENAKEKFEKFITLKWVLIFLVIAFSFFGACNYLNKITGLENDHPFEQQIEKVIAHETGLDIDLSN